MLSMIVCALLCTTPSLSLLLTFQVLAIAIVAVLIYGASPNFFDVTLPGFLNVHQQDESSDIDLMQQLYTPLGSASAFIGTLYQTLLGIKNLDTHFLLQIDCM
jgi:hypothetical protein